MLAGIVILASTFLIYRKLNSADSKLSEQKEDLPSPAKTDQLPVSSVTADIPVATKVSPPSELNLDVPFTSQAPDANWDHTHEEACEEAAILMANRFFQGRTIDGSADAEAGLQEIITWEKENLDGVWESTTAEQSAEIISEMLGLKAEIIKNPKVNEIKQAIAENKLVIAPMAGRQIPNPFYKAPGPLYHMLLIKGYTQDKFITNDAGTKRGANYPYNFKTLLDASHDWNGGAVESGQKVMIVVGK